MAGKSRVESGPKCKLLRRGFQPQTLPFLFTSTRSAFRQRVLAQDLRHVTRISAYLPNSMTETNSPPCRKSKSEQSAIHRPHLLSNSMFPARYSPHTTTFSIHQPIAQIETTLLAARNVSRIVNIFETAPTAILSFKRK